MALGFSVSSQRSRGARRRVGATVTGTVCSITGVYCRWASYCGAGVQRVVELQNAAPFMSDEVMTEFRVTSGLRGLMEVEAGCRLGCWGRRWWWIPAGAFGGRRRSWNCEWSVLLISEVVGQSDRYYWRTGMLWLGRRLLRRRTVVNKRRLK